MAEHAAPEIGAIRFPERAVNRTHEHVGCHRFGRRHGVKLLSVHRRQEVDAVVRALRELTVARGLAVVAVSNLAKGVGRDTRAGGVGKESSEIDFAADLLLLAEPDDDVDEDGLRPVRWRCMKNRHGAQRNLEALFDGGLQLFSRPEAEEYADFAGFKPRDDA
jgi:hypothetical protein